MKEIIQLIVVEGMLRNARTVVDSLIRLFFKSLLLKSYRA